jgi:NAD(P)H-dependent FMN reductase
MRLLAISGSLRAGSSNTALLHAARLLAPVGVDICPYDGVAGLPAFDPDLDRPGVPLPRAVADLRARVSGADALLVSSPEYAHGIPGSLKNLLDWLVGDTAFAGKRVTILAASTRSVLAQAQLAEVLRTMSARLVPDGCVVVPLDGSAMDAASIAADARSAAVLCDAIAALARTLPRSGR